MSESATATEADLWIKTVPTAVNGGEYEVEISVGRADWKASLSRSECLNHASACHAVLARADFDLAVMRQQVEIGLTPEHAATTVHELREARTPIPFPASGLSFSYGIARDVQADGSPEFRTFVIMSINGAQVAQLDTQGLREHAEGVMFAMHTVGLESDYLRYMMLDLGVDPDIAQGAVATLIEHRP